MDPLLARQGGDPRLGGLEFEFETTSAPVAWIQQLARAHPQTRLQLLFDRPDDQCAGEIIYEGGVEHRRSEIANDGYELWLQRSAGDSMYGEHEPPYRDVRLD